jgi:UDP-2,3-diacylglucosamine hydrolase
MPSGKPVLLASDIHLGAVPRERERAFLSWLRHTGDRASWLILNGDLFDFWFEYRQGIPRGYDETLGVLRALVRGGLPVTLMGGNHDWWGGSYLRDEIGVEFLQDPVVRDIGGLRTFLAHGDGLGKGDLGYRFLRLILRGRLTRWAFRQLPPDLGDRVAGRVSQTEVRWGAPTEDDKNRARFLEHWALAKLEAEPDIDLVVLGHTHIPVKRTVAGGRWYVNAGDWVYHRTYLEFPGGGAEPQLIEWGG